MRTLLAVPNFSEGRDASLIGAIGEAMLGAADVRLLDVHSDADHHRSVYSLAGAPGALVSALVAGARLACAEIDLGLRAGEGVVPGAAAGAAADPARLGGAPGAHPHVGALDVAPLVFCSERDRGAACAAALVLGDRLGEEIGLPVFLYGLLAGGRSRAQLRRGGLAGLGARVEAGELAPDFGRWGGIGGAGAVLVAARPPLVAFNVQLAPPADMALARSIAAAIREGGAEGMPGLRAIAVPLHSRGITQISMNVEQPLRLPLAEIVAAIGRRAAIDSAELVGLAPSAAIAGFPANVSLGGFDADRQLLERALPLPATH